MQELEDMLKDIINKQHIDFYAEFVKYNFWWLNERLYVLESFSRMMDA